jgi:hypothetical protein
VAGVCAIAATGTRACKEAARIATMVLRGMLSSYFDVQRSGESMGSHVVGKEP